MLDCGHEPTAERFGTGYATTGDGQTLCYPCAEERERHLMAESNVYVCYMGASGTSVTNWSGGFLGEVLSHHVSSAARKTYVQVRAWDDSLWHGQGPAESGSYVTLRRSVRSRP